MPSNHEKLTIDSPESVASETQLFDAAQFADFQKLRAAGTIDRLRDVVNAQYVKEYSADDEVQIPEPTLGDPDDMSRVVLAFVRPNKNAHKDDRVTGFRIFNQKVSDGGQISYTIREIPMEVLTNDGRVEVAEGFTDEDVDLADAMLIAYTNARDELGLFPHLDHTSSEIIDPNMQMMASPAKKAGALAVNRAHKKD